MSLGERYSRYWGGGVRTNCFPAGAGAVAACTTRLARALARASAPGDARWRNAAQSTPSPPRNLLHQETIRSITSEGNATTALVPVDHPLTSRNGDDGRRSSAKLTPCQCYQPHPRRHDRRAGAGVRPPCCLSARNKAAADALPRDGGRRGATRVACRQPLDWVGRHVVGRPVDSCRHARM